MNVLNFFDEVFTVQVSAGENTTGLKAVVDTGLGYTVVVLNSANAAGPSVGAGLTETSNAVSGKLFNPSSTYSGNEGEMTWCIYGSDDTISTSPTSANISGLACS